MTATSSPPRRPRRRSALPALPAALADLRRDRRGGVLALTALTLPVILLICALAIDLGFFLVATSRAETAALFAAESGLVRLPDRAAAEALAEEVGVLHLDGAPMVEDVAVAAEADADGIEVRVDVAVSAVFAALAGQPDMTASTALRLER